MALRDIAYRGIERGRSILGVPSRTIKLSSFEIDAKEAARLSNGASGRMGDVCFAHSGRQLHKWLHYLEIYECHFRMYHNTPVKMLEIGVSQGGSLEIWRKYFGADATIFGIDIRPECASRVTPPNQVRIGSQDDPQFLHSVIDEMGMPDIILDDGSHLGRHQRVSFDTLFPLLKEGGLYVIEDLHTSYFPGHGEGGYRRKGTAIEHIKDMIDDMHAWYHSKPTTTPAKEQIGAIHLYDSVVVIEKRKTSRPVVVHIGDTVP